MLTLTPSAQKAVNRFIQGPDTAIAGLRIAVTGGGCSGLQYAMNLVGDKEVSYLEVACGRQGHARSPGEEVSTLASSAP